MATRTLYSILEVSETASPSTIRAAYDRLCTQWDPARPFNNDAEARARYAQIKNAYATLGNLQKRLVYDRTIEKTRSAASPKRSNPVYKIALVSFIVVLGAYYYSVEHFQGKPAAALVTAQPAAPSVQPAAVATITKTPIATVEEREDAKAARASNSFFLKLDTELAVGQRTVKSVTPL